MKSSQNRYKSVTSYVVLALALISIAFLGVVNPNRGQSGLGAIVAKVDGVDIKREDFLRRYQRILNYYKQFQGADLDPASLGLAGNVLKSMIDELAWYQTARDNGALASIEEISSKIVEQPSFYDKDGKFSRKLMQQVLLQNGLTENALAEDIRFQLSSSKLRQHIFNQVFVPSQMARLDQLLKETKVALSYVRIEASKLKVSVTDEQVKKFLEGKTAEKEVSMYYNRNKSDYKAPEAFRLSQILVSYKGAERASDMTRSKDEALKRAKTLLAGLKKDPKTFETVARKETDDKNSKDKNGSLGFLKSKEIPAPIVESLKKLKKGAISDVIETPFGYHIVRFEAKREKKDISLEEATNSIAKKLLEEKERYKSSNELAKELLALLKEGKSAEALMKKNGLKWEETPEISLKDRSIPSHPEEFVDAALGLTKVGDVHPRVINKYKVNYLVKLASKKKADQTKISEEDTLALREDLEDQAERNILFYFEKLISDSIRDEAKHSIYINPQYEALDNPRS